MGLKFGGDGFVGTEQNIAMCSAISRGVFRYLINNCPVTFHQILYPYADMLSLSCNPGTESTRIFGTHMILGGIEEDFVAAALFDGFASVADNGRQPDVTVHHFRLNDGCPTVEEIAAFLECDSDVPTVGDFAKMLGGFVSHWHIREAAKVFASFSEMSYRVSTGAVCGLAGGQLALRRDIDPNVMEEIRQICFQKTGITVE